MIDKQTDGWVKVIRGTKSRASADCLQRVVRPRSARPCSCRPVGQNPYGYIVFKWTLIAGGRWKTVCITANVHDAVAQANKKKIKTVLIKCRNCGQEALRERPNAKVSV
jgi:hypothetical protein